MYDFSAPMALVDFVPVILFGIAAVLLMRDLYNKMTKYAFACLAAGTIDAFIAGFLKATWKLLYAAGLCDFHVLNTMFLPTQSLGLLLTGLGIVIMLVLIAEVIFFAHKEEWPKIQVKRTKKEIVHIFLDAIPALLTPIIILGGIYSGLLTATESAAVACVWAFIAGTFIYRELTIRDIIPILMKSAKSSAMILFIIAASTAFSWVFTYSGASKALVEFVIGMNLNRTLFCLVVAIILLIFGTFMEGTAIAVLLVPVLWPIASSMGINVIHFGMILCISNVIGTMTPPVAVNIFSAVQVSRSVRELKIGEIAKAEIPFFIGYTAVFFLCVFSEKFCTFLIK